MKKKLLLLTLFVGIFSLVSTADPFYKKRNKSSGGAVEEGTKIVEAYYGYNSLVNMGLRAFVKSIHELDGYTGTDYTFEARGTGIIGGRFEYLITDHLGVSASLMYENLNFKYIVVEDGNMYSQKLAFTRLGLLAGLNVHFLTQESLDPYFVFGLGYMNYTAKYTTTGIAIDDEKFRFTIPVPLAIRLGLGARYFFTDNIGLKIEAGIGGGGILEGGIAFKF